MAQPAHIPSRLRSRRERTLASIKDMPYISDINLSFNRVSAIPQSHIDSAPTLFDIAEYPGMAIAVSFGRK